MLTELLGGLWLLIRIRRSGVGGAYSDDTQMQLALGELRIYGATAPIGVGNWGPLRDDERCLPFVDCLLTHRYYVPHCMTREQFAANVAETAACPGV